MADKPLPEAIPNEMTAMRIHAMDGMEQQSEPLIESRIPVPAPAEGEVLIRVIACGVCHTELDEIEGRTPPLEMPIIPGHQVCGEVVAHGPGIAEPCIGRRVGVAWIWSSCGRCPRCADGKENLCVEFRATGRDRNGGYAQYMVAPAAFVHTLPDGADPLATAPLLCAGAVGYRALRLCALEDGQALGLTGFGASNHLVLQMARAQYPQSPVAVFARNIDEQGFARELGAAWAGDTHDRPPFELDAIIDTTPAWLPVIEAMKNLAPGGRLVVNAIRKQDEDKKVLLELDYESQLWMEKSLSSVANVTRQDVRECLELASRTGISPEFQVHALERANEALQAVKRGGNRGAQVLKISRY